MEGRMGAIDADSAFAEHVSEMVKAIGNHTRIRIVSALCEGEANVGAIAERLGAAPAIVSQQLKILRMHGLVEAVRGGGFATYRLAVPRIKDLVRCLEGCTTYHKGER
jgi:DNA-binding transcriptional ArsR family regulator